LLLEKPMFDRALSFVPGWTVVALALVAFPVSAAPLPKVVDFNRDIRPILSDNCWKCHGPDRSQRKAGLRLDTKDGLLGKGEETAVVVPGKPDMSELYRRLICSEESRRMPQVKSGKSLTERQIALVKKWIEQGAEWKGHWAFIKPVKPEVPVIEDGFVRNAIDRFILARLREENLKPAPEADRVTLIRRLSFDLIGLPPTLEEVHTFVNDKRPDAYERLVDRLLASPHHGERMAMYWLDQVRYADSIGYHSDNPMNVSPYRDYVLRAFNTNKRFDRFTIEQLAGDMLADATLEQKVASAYNRLLQTTEEGGAQAKEYEAKYAADRVRNVSTVWLGATMGCCQCHDHKFDPFKLKDFYRFAAFFADVKEAAVGRREAGIAVPTDEQTAELKKLDAAVAALKKKLDTTTPELQAVQKEWEKQPRDGADWKTLKPDTLTAANGTTLTAQADGSILASGKFPAKEKYTLTLNVDLKGVTAFRLEVLPDASFKANGPGVSENGNFVLTAFHASTQSGKQPLRPVKFTKATVDFAQDTFPVANLLDTKNKIGWAILPQVGQAHVVVFETAAPLGAAETVTIVLDHQSIYPKHNLGKFRLSTTTSANPAKLEPMPATVTTALAVDAEKRTAQQKQVIAAYYRGIAPLLAPVRADLATKEKAKADLLKKVPTCLVTTAGPPRTVRVLPRGNWLDDKGEVVAPGVPAFLPQLAQKKERATRLDLAKWIVSRDNPLTARVFVNRLWKLYFGEGLARTLDDLGAQGEWPTHHELFDWLAVEFVDSGWDMRHMIKLIVLSSTYRQSSQMRPELKDRDPFNHLYARQSRWRLDAEEVRDAALAVSGLLNREIGGPSAKPYQPAGYWSALNFPTREWENDHGANLYRRGLYTHWQRSFLHPSLMAFDAPSREECCVSRTRSNIPQQALVLLNDPTYVEAARTFAERILKEGTKSTEDRLAFAFGIALSRKPKAEEVRVLRDLLVKHRRQYAKDREAAEKLLHTGAHSIPDEMDLTELAAWTSVARVILNLHEMITRY
jgi:hypothetical protein